jgi:hypothetical protein
MKSPSARGKKRPYRPRPPIGSEVSWLVRDIDHNTPAGLCEAFSYLARFCLEDAKKLDECWKGYYSAGEYILIAHALELSLKAFLARHELPEEELRKQYGHDLDRLYDAAVERGLALPSITAVNVKGIITWINEYHSEGEPVRYALRYAALTRTLPAGAVVFPIIDAILLAAGASEKRSRSLKSHAPRLSSSEDT